MDRRVTGFMDRHDSPNLNATTYNQVPGNFQMKHSERTVRWMQLGPQKQFLSLFHYSNKIA